MKRHKIKAKLLLCIYTCVHFQNTRLCRTEIDKAQMILLCLLFIYETQVFKNEPSKYCGRQSLKNLKEKQTIPFEFFKGCLHTNFTWSILESFSYIFYRIIYLIVKDFDDFLSIKYVTLDRKSSKEEKRPQLKVFQTIMS